MGKYLVTFNDVYNEVDINGFKIMTDKEVESFEELASSISWSFTYPLNVGELEFSNGDDLLSRLEFKEITNEEFKLIKKIFNEEFGIFINTEYLEELIDDEEDLDDEDDDDDDDDDLDDGPSHRSDPRYNWYDEDNEF